MADLRGSANSDRGQILLIAAFTLAVIFVALALVINSAIFTQNMASRGEVVGSSDALLYQQQVEQSVGEAIRYANEDGSLTIQGSISDIGEAGGRQQIRDGRLINVSLASSPTIEKRIAFESSGDPFLSQNGDENWQLATDVEGTRNFQIEANVLASSSADAFTIQANGSGTAGDIWSLSIHDDGTDYVLEVDPGPDGPSSMECKVSSGSPLEVDVMRGTANGHHCPALTRDVGTGEQMWWATGVTASDYEIWMKNGDQIEGDFSMVVDGTHNSTNLQLGSTVGDPYHTDAIYSVDVEYLYLTPNVEYEAEIEVAPGETPS